MTEFLMHLQCLGANLSKFQNIGDRHIIRACMKCSAYTLSANLSTMFSILLPLHTITNYSFSFKFFLPNINIQLASNLDQSNGTSTAYEFYIE